jgi:hypothetical protein
MDDTWRKVKGTKVVAEGAAIQVFMETVDGRTMVVQLVPEAVTGLVTALVNAKTEAIFIEAGGPDAAIPPTSMRQAVEAETFEITDYVKDGRCLIQVVTAGGGIFEFMVPMGRARRHDVQT